MPTPLSVTDVCRGFRMTRFIDHDSLGAARGSQERACSDGSSTASYPPCREQLGCGTRVLSSSESLRAGDKAAYRGKTKSNNACRT